MPEQLTLFPELAKKLVLFLDDQAEDYASKAPSESWVGTENIRDFRKAVAQAYKDGAATVLGDVIDIVKKYNNVYEV